jgi:hypothetical protein
MMRGHHYQRLESSPMRTTLIIGLISLLPAFSASAAQPEDFLAEFSVRATQEGAGFPGFDAERGRQFFISRHGGDWSCSSCHTGNPAASGQHVLTHKTIQPLAPAANPERFTQAPKVEKWFKRNCRDVLKRDCTAREKGDVLTYLLTLGR